MARNKLTLLEVVQRTLNAMNHDSVNSISDTVESLQIAEEAKNTYYDLMDRDDWAHLVQLLPLTGLSDTDQPTHFQIPSTVVRIDDVRYNIRVDTDTYDRIERLKYLEPETFLDHLNTRRSDETNVQTVLNVNSVKLMILNDKAPEWWTSFDDDFVICDSFDSVVDTTLQGSKSQMLGKVIPEWTESDAFIADMPEQMFSVWQAEVTAAAFTYWKQGTSIKDEQRSRRGISRLRKDARKINERDQRAKFGRKRFTVVRNPDGTATS